MFRIEMTVLYNEAIRSHAMHMITCGPNVHIGEEEVTGCNGSNGYM